MSDELSLDHYQTGPKTSPEPHKRIMINIIGISYLLLITPDGESWNVLPITQASPWIIGWSDYGGGVVV